MEKYQPDHEEIGAAMGWMDDYQKLMSDDREVAFENLSEDEKQRLEDCDLKYSNGNGINTRLEGMIKGNKVSLHMTQKPEETHPGDRMEIFIEGTVNDVKLTIPQVIALMHTYKNIAKFQSAVDDISSHKKNYQFRAMEMNTEDVVNDLLS